MPDCPRPDRIEATATQLLTGLTPATASDSVHCPACGGKIQPGTNVVVIAQRCVEACAWSVPRVYCHPCYDGFKPTLGAVEVVATAGLGSVLVPTGRTHRPCLTEVAIQHVSPPVQDDDCR
jgi:hypothetical protein